MFARLGLKVAGLFALDARTRRRKPRLLCESLEDRCNPVLIFTVNTTDDTPDALILNGLAQDANGNTSLRSAVEEGNAQAALWTQTNGARGDNNIQIQFGIPAQGPLTISLATALQPLQANFTIIGPGPQALSIQPVATATTSFPVFSITSGATVTIQRLDIANGTDSGIQNQGTLTLEGCSIHGNSSVSSGGGIDSTGNLTVTDSGIYANTTAGNGGGISFGGTGTLSITNSSLYLNESVMGGGALYTGGANTQLNNVNIFANEAGDNGGGVFVAGGTLTMTGGEIDSNSAGGTAAKSTSMARRPLSR